MYIDKISLKKVMGQPTQHMRSFFLSYAQLLEKQHAVRVELDSPARGIADVTLGALVGRFGLGAA